MCFAILGLALSELSEEPKRWNPVDPLVYTPSEGQSYEISEILRIISHISHKFHNSDKDSLKFNDMLYGMFGRRDPTGASEPTWGFKRAFLNRRKRSLDIFN